MWNTVKINCNTNYGLEKCGSPILVVKAVILPNLVYDKMRSLYNITKSSIDLLQKGGGVNCGPLKIFTEPGLFVTFRDPLESIFIY